MGWGGRGGEGGSCHWLVKYIFILCSKYFSSTLDAQGMCLWKPLRKRLTIGWITNCKILTVWADLSDFVMLKIEALYNKTALTTRYAVWYRLNLKIQSSHSCQRRWSRNLIENPLWLLHLNRMKQPDQSNEIHNLHRHVFISWCSNETNRSQHTNEKNTCSQSQSSIFSHPAGSKYSSSVSVLWIQLAQRRKWRNR